MTVPENNNPSAGVSHHFPWRVLQETKCATKSDTQVAIQFSVKFKHFILAGSLRCASGIPCKSYTENKKIKVNFSSYILSVLSWFLILTQFLHVAMNSKQCSLFSQNKGLRVKVSQQKRKLYFKKHYKISLRRYHFCYFLVLVAEVTQATGFQTSAKVPMEGCVCFLHLNRQTSNK